MKQIEVTFNDDTTQADIDGAVELLRVVFDNFQITAVIIVKNEPIKKHKTVRVNDLGFTTITGKKRRLHE
jgi:hypothetical protein